MARGPTCYCIVSMLYETCSAMLGCNAILLQWAAGCRGAFSILGLFGHLRHYSRYRAVPLLRYKYGKEDIACSPYVHTVKVGSSISRGS